MKPRRFSKPTFLQKYTLSSEPNRPPQRVPEHALFLLSRAQDITFSQQARKVVAARQVFDDICHRDLVTSFQTLTMNEVSSTSNYDQRKRCAENDWKMNMADLLQIGKTQLREMNPGVGNLTRHAEFKHTLRDLRRRLEVDAASESPRLTREENREIGLEIVKFKDAKKALPRCSHWNQKHDRLNCQKCGRFTECTPGNTRK